MASERTSTQGLIRLSLAKAEHCQTELDRVFLNAAFMEAQNGNDEGGIPIGAVLVHGEKVIGHGHNRRVQESSPVLHAEIDCLKNAGRLSPSSYKECTLYSTLSPCDMCSGAILLYGIPRVVVGENVSFRGPEDYLRQRGVDVTVADDVECRRLMEDFIKTNPRTWHEDIGSILEQ